MWLCIACWLAWALSDDSSGLPRRRLVWSCCCPPSTSGVEQLQPCHAYTLLLQTGVCNLPLDFLHPYMVLHMLPHPIDFVQNCMNGGWWLPNVSVLIYPQIKRLLHAVWAPTLGEFSSLWPPKWQQLFFLDTSDHRVPVKIADMLILFSHSFSNLLFQQINPWTLNLFSAAN